MNEQRDPAHVVCPITGETLVFEWIDYDTRPQQNAHYDMIEQLLSDMGWHVNEANQWQATN